MLHDIMPGTEEQLLKEPTAGYIGFDPTADSLHVGHLVQVFTLMHLQRAGHRPLALVGGATGMIGDPSGKSEERNLLSEEALRHNEACVAKQLRKFLDFETKVNPAEMVNNYDWFKDMSFLDFLRDVGKHLTVNYMMAKDSVKKRLETGISYTEFAYQLVQGFDFYYLYTHKGCKLQMGGSDQWGNIVTGTELIRRKAGGEAYALTTSLITKADGGKFGKTESGSVWIDPDRTSPYQFYQFWLNTADQDAVKYIRIFTFRPKEELDALIAAHEQAPHQRILQRVLAEELTSMVHSRHEYETAVKASAILFGNAATEELASIDERTLLQVFEGVPQVEISREALEQVADVAELLSATTQGQVFGSKSEARRMIAGGGVSINKQKVAAAEEKPAYNLLQGRYLLVQKGKKNYYLIRVV